MFALWICSLLVPVIVIITGRMMWKHYPKNIDEKYRHMEIC